MPGKHAPESSASFVLSLTRWAAAAAAAIGAILVVLLLLVGGGKSSPEARSSPTSTASASGAPSPVGTISSRPHDQVAIAVFNATNHSGLAGSVGDALSNEGYDVRRVDNAAPTSLTTIYYGTGAGADAKALLGAHPELGRIAQRRPNQPKGFALIVVLGSDYRSP